MPTELVSYDVYNSGMKKSIKDKLFFEGLVEEVDELIDLGCADGTLLKQIHEDFPEWNLIGIDNDEVMVEQAEQNCPEAFIIKNNLLEDIVCEEDNNTIINLSSVIHEIYSYCTEEEVKQFWDDLFNLECKYIAIRDLMISNSANRRSDLNDHVKVLRKASEKQMSDFYDNWGSFTSQRNLLHFLLKYRYVENWDREVRENYFPITIEELLSLIPTDRYEIVYFNHYILPFNQSVIKKDFDVDIKDNTHIKLLLRRKDNG